MNTQGKYSIGKRTASFLLSLVVLLGLVPVLPQMEARAEDWTTPYLQQLNDQGIMQGDENGNLNGDKPITRAEFTALVNRSYGYHDVGTTPFSDVPDTAWYAEDIGIAYNAGYFAGTSPTTAAPDKYLTREEAVVLLGRNMRYQGTTGEALGFNDNRDISTWSRGMVQEAYLSGIIAGYPNGNFGPQDHITRGQMAAILVRSIGSFVHTSGEQSLGSVYGNVTINTSGVKLKDTIITGNLYLSGGVGLGSVELENVTVLGKIIVSGSGESEQGDASILLRNVTAKSMEVDSIVGQFMTLRSEGDTDIPLTTVRTNAYIEDISPTGKGLHVIQLNGQSGAELGLAGNIKEVVSLTPNSVISLGRGSAQKITVDEKATGTTLNLALNTNTQEVNLDGPARVTGSGDIAKININSNGSTVDQLPDDIVVRPDVTANVNKKNMDTNAAAESSSEPRLLNGYPFATDVAPTSATALFSTNKAGTVYWALSAVADGSVGEDDLVTPPAYSGKILKKGNIKVNASKTEVSTKLTGLTQDGSYYISAVLVDDRGQRSPVKVTAFTTPDDTVPNFAAGYPVMTNVTNEDAQATVMTTKSADMYWAVLPKGSTAPKAQDFKANSLAGNLGAGNMEVIKNSTQPLYVNNPTGNLEELQTYDLYMWLTDFDGAKSSAVKKLSFTTVDRTPPKVTTLYQSNSAAKTVTITYAVDEPATLFWAVVPEGDDFIRPASVGEEIDLKGLAAKVQVEAGTYSTKNGKANAAKENTNYNFTISGLEEERSYDLYYVAKDKAGNYSEAVLVFSPVKTLDNKPPTAEQEFSLVQTDGVKVSPLAESDVTLAFSEVVWGTYNEKGVKKFDDFADLYTKVQAADIDGIVEGSDEEKALAEAKKNLGDALRRYIQFYSVSSGGLESLAVDRSSEDYKSKNNALPEQSRAKWDIDYENATVRKENGRTYITFPFEEGINLTAGGKYYFKLGTADGVICDTSGNNMTVTQLPDFQVVFATVNLSVSDTTRLQDGSGDSLTNAGAVTDTTSSSVNDPYRVDLAFYMRPTSTQRVPEDTRWDMQLWTDTTMDFRVYYRDQDEDGNWDDWTLLNSPSSASNEKKNGIVSANIAGAPAPDHRVYASVSKHILEKDDLEKLNTVKNVREYAVHVDKIEADDKYSSWNKTVNMRVTVTAGGSNAMSLISQKALSYQSNYDDGLKAGVQAIGVRNPFDVVLPFTDSEAPNISTPYPAITAGDVGATIQFMIDRPGSVYYVAVPLSNVTYEKDELNDKQDKLVDDTKIIDLEKTGNKYTAPVPPAELSGSAQPYINTIPVSGDEDADENEHATIPLKLSSPPTTLITRGVTNSPGVVSGSINGLEAHVSREVSITDLQPNTTYLLYVVTQGISAVYSPNTMVYRFTTKNAELPRIQVTRVSSSTAVISTNKSTQYDYALIPNSNLQKNAEFNVPFAGTLVNSDWASASFDGKDSVKTVLDAMLTPYFETGNKYMGSVFDNFASDNAKDRYGLLVRQMASDSTTTIPPAMVGSERLVVAPNQATAEKTMTMINMAGTNYYTLFVVGRTLNSDRDAFIASRSYFNQDTGYLRVTNAVLNRNNASTADTFYGTLTITLSDDLYCRIQQNNDEFYPRVDSCPLLHDAHAGDSTNMTADHEYINIYSIMNIAGGGGKITLTNAGPSGSGETLKHQPVNRTLTFNLEYVKNDASITLNADICGANQSVRPGQSLTITLKRSTTVETYYEYDAEGNEIAKKRTLYSWEPIIPAEWTK